MRHGEPILFADGNGVPQIPLPVKVDEGKQFYDSLWLQDRFNFTVSHRIRHAGIEAEMMGYRSCPLQIERAWHGAKRTRKGAAQTRDACK